MDFSIVGIFRGLLTRCYGRQTGLTSVLRLGRSRCNICKRYKHHSQRSIRFGLCFDIDGVLARGEESLPAAREAIKLLQSKRGGHLTVPTVFLTNALVRPCDKARQISQWFDIEVRDHQVVPAQAPLQLFHNLHKEQVLVIGQGPVRDIATELGFCRISTMEEVLAAYPLLNVVDLEKRLQLPKEDLYDEQFPRISAIALLGEPVKWEASLQVLVDLLLTNGKPAGPGTSISHAQSIPVVACNVDMFWMHRAFIPRYGHGAFLLCLETLYQKVVGHQLNYKALLGKPSESTFRFAEHCLAEEARYLGLTEPVMRMYMIGDNIQADIAGGNLYQKYISKLKHGQTLDIPSARLLPDDCRESLHPQTVDHVETILVSTGVHNTSNLTNGHKGAPVHAHREFHLEPELLQPSTKVETVLQGVQYIMNKENLM